MNEERDVIQNVWDLACKREIKIVITSEFCTDNLPAFACTVSSAEPAWEGGTEYADRIPEAIQNALESYEQSLPRRGA